MHQQYFNLYVMKKAGINTLFLMSFGNFIETSQQVKWNINIETNELYE